MVDLLLVQAVELELLVQDFPGAWHGHLDQPQLYLQDCMPQQVYQLEMRCQAVVHLGKGSTYTALHTSRRAAQLPACCLACNRQTA